MYYHTTRDDENDNISEDNHFYNNNNDVSEGASLDLRRDVDPNSVYELVSLIGEGSYGAVYKAYPRDGHFRTINGNNELV